MKRSPLSHDPARAAEKRARREARRAAEGPRPEDIAREERAITATRARSNGRVRGVCICGCKRPAVHWHHCVYEQELRSVYRATGPRAVRGGLERDPAWIALTSDPRNLAPVAFDCHGAHHGRSAPYSLAALPDSVFEFAAEVLGPRAHGYLRRRYAGRDARLDDLLRMAA